MFNSLWPHGLQHTRLFCPPLSPKVCPGSCPLSQWCNLSILPSATPFSISSIFPTIRVFSNGLVLCIRWPKYWSFSISPSNEYSGLISFRIDWLYLLKVQGTLKSLLQCHSLKALILWCSVYFLIMHDYWKTIALIMWTFIGKEMSLLFNMLSRSVIAFFPRSKCILISWLQSLSTMILELRKENLSLFPLFPHLFAMKWWEQMPWYSFLECWFLSQLLHPSLSPLSRGSLVPLYFLPLEWYHLHIWGCWYFSWQSWFQLVTHAAQNFAWCTCIWVK